jgi:hypothetical protein
MNEIITLSVFEIVGSSLCAASDDGEKVYERIRKAIRQGRSVALSFLNVTSMSPTFLKDMEPDDLVLLKRVVETAKAYFKNPELHQKRF